MQLFFQKTARAGRAIFIVENHEPDDLIEISNKQKVGLSTHEYERTFERGGRIAYITGE
jgi:hypothetical protein